jgi:ribonuclease HII
VPQETLVGGDGRCVSIAAASILAKVSRDRMMAEYDLLYPGYGLSGHKGYPTREHLEAIRRLGPSPIHRRTFRGVVV